MRTVRNTDLPRDRPVAVIADDLTGAAEAALALRDPGADVTVELIQARLSGRHEDVVAVDTCARVLPAHAATEAARRAVDIARVVDRLVYKKVDSGLRGHVAAEMAALSGGPIVFAPSLPAARRSVVDAVPLVDGIPLRESDLWRAETAAPLWSVLDAVGPHPASSIPLDRVRGAHLEAEIRQTVTAGRIAVCDAATDADLDAIAAAALRMPGIQLVGSAGLAAAVGRLRRSRGTEGAAPATGVGSGPLVVVGSIATAAHSQTEALRERGLPHHLLSSAGAEAVDAAAVARLSGLLVHTPAILALDAANRIDPREGSRLMARLAAMAAAVVEATTDRVDLLLIGGHTSRAVLDALGIDRLAPEFSLGSGAVVSRAPDGRQVLTRAGSFGSIADIANLLTKWRTP